MTEQKRREMYVLARNLWGIQAQVFMVMEEAGEMLNALAKANRGRSSKEEIITELADVSIMVEQMAQHFGWYDFHRERARKLNRLEERINKELARREAPQDEPQPKRKLVIGLDFNGTCLTYNFPDGIGHDIGAVPVLRRIIDAGHQIVLMTGADREPMEAQQMECYQKSIEWFEKNGIPLVGINNNPTLTYQPKKLCCDLYIDDHCLGIPMTANYALSDRPFVDWQRVEILLEELGII